MHLRLSQPSRQRRPRLSLRRNRSRLSRPRPPSDGAAQTLTLYVNGVLTFQDYTYTWGLASDTDVIGITSQFGYLPVTASIRTNGGQVFYTFIYLVDSLTTPYGTTVFNGVDNGNTRTEKDSMGEMQVPIDALYGASTQRAVLNFPISDLRYPRRFIRALGQVKLAAAETNSELGLVDREITAAIAEAAS